MKKYMSKFFILTLSILVSSAVQAGTVTDTFNTDDVLTATQMTNIKNAVNDNDTNISSFFGGDGSAGDLTVDANLNWSVVPPANPYFANITIDAGQILTVPAGTTIRCSGAFTNNGTLVVNGGASSDGTSFQIGDSGSSGAQMVSHPGDTPRAAVPGMMDNDMITNPVFLNTGPGGAALTEAVVRVSSFGRFRIGGGSGAGPFQNIRGGGLVKIYCQGAIVNAGTIQADGANVGAFDNAHGGGGGGIVILASRTLIDNFAGTISVLGGDGGDANAFWGGAGGGGGGGIIVMASPTTPVLGAETVTGGTAGAGGTVLTNQTRVAGGGGGGSGGNGGAGGSISNADTNGGGAGSDGYVVTMDLDPIWIAR